MEELTSHWTDFREIWHKDIFQKSVEKTEVSSKSVEKTEVSSKSVEKTSFIKIC
jgi:hypothetical protein